MTFHTLFEFLRDLNKNNSKEWMDANRKRYEDVRDFYIGWLNGMDEKLAKIDSEYTRTTGKKALNRINNNLMFHPDKPTYKDNFGASLDKGEDNAEFYIHLGLNGSFIAGGFYHPKPAHLKSIRDGIDYNGDALKKILGKKSFEQMFGGLIEEGDALKTSPKGYSQDHKHIELLRMKTFAVSHDITQKDAMGDDFEKIVKDVYKEMLPFRRYLEQAVTV